MKPGSIRWRLVISYVLLTVLTVSLVGMLTLTLLEGYVKAQAESQLEANARTIARQASLLMVPQPKLQDLRELVQSISFLGRMRVRILDNQDQIIIDSGPALTYTSVLWVQPDTDEIDSPSFLMPIARGLEEELIQKEWVRENVSDWPSIVVRVEEGPWGRDVVFQTAYGEEVISPSSLATLSPNQTVVETSSWASVRMPIGEEEIPLGYVQLDSPPDSGEEILAVMRWALLMAGVISGVIAAVAGLLVSRGLSAPILALADSANRMSSGDLAARAPIQSSGEIGQLSRQFNLMAERLQTSFNTLSAERDSLRRFIADASHELRTPITALHNFIELLQGPASNDCVVRDEFLMESQIQVRRMEWITGNLLDLSRLDAGLIQMNRQDINLNDLLQSATAPFLPIADDKGVHIQVEPTQYPVLANCDRTRMEIVLGNLLDNAIKFTPPGGTVSLRGEVRSGKVRIQVKDSGAGILSDDLPLIFNRFYRGHTTEPGSGLGLSIVQSIIQAHGGVVEVQSQPGQGSLFTVTI